MSISRTPSYITFFSWAFTICLPIVVINLTVNEGKLYLYGLYAYPRTPWGLFVSLLYIYKAVVSINIIRKKRLAIILALIDGLLGIVIYLVVLGFTLANITVSDSRFFGLDILFLIPYFKHFYNEMKKQNTA